MMYIPKGGMCRTCKHRDKDCSHLDFKSMPVIDKNQELTVVRCNEFERMVDKENK